MSGKLVQSKAQMDCVNPSPKKQWKKKPEPRGVPSWNMASLKLCVCFWPWAFIQLNIQIPWEKKKRRLTPVLHLSPLGVKKKMNVALNSVHLQTNGLTLPPPSLSCPPPHHTLCPLLWIKTCTHTCTHRESCPLIKGLVSPNPRFLPCRKCLSF